EGKLNVSKVVTTDDGFDEEKALADFVGAFPERNSTLKAIAEKFPANDSLAVKRKIPFSSARKYSAVQLENGGTLVLGALEFVCPNCSGEILKKCEAFYADGYRVVVLAHSAKPLNGNSLPDELDVKAIITLSDIIRPTAKQTLEYFASQSVDVKIISGDALPAVVSIARRVNLANAENAVDLSQVPDELIPDICEKYSIFCRANPDQKLLLIKSLKALGHKTAMTGDGVNDVLALREADCSIAMSTGSDAARTVSQVVLMDSDFSSIPLVVQEGRRCINNIQRSSTLFLSKTVFSVLLTTLYLFLPLNYPLMPVQLTLISAFAIGIPSFFLALEPNTNRISGSFIKNIMTKALPVGTSAAVGVAALNVLDIIFSLSNQDVTTMAAFITAAAFFGGLWNTCKPFNKRRAAMFAILLGLFSAAAFLFSEVFYLYRLSAMSTLLLVIIILAVLLLQATLRKSLGKR
ncbi:MAG: HAD-IC family P-type ATPase, partial [Oscillospiraceae bacterium]